MGSLLITLAAFCKTAATAALSPPPACRQHHHLLHLPIIWTEDVVATTTTGDRRIWDYKSCKHLSHSLLLPYKEGTFVAATRTCRGRVGCAPAAHKKILEVYHRLGKHIRIRISANWWSDPVCFIITTHIYLIIPLLFYETDTMTSVAYSSPDSFGPRRHDSR